MRIECTVKEFGQMVRACENTSRMINCHMCPLNALCDRSSDEKIEQFIAAKDVVDDVLREYFAGGGASDG